MNDNRILTISAVIWLAGAGVLWLVWNNRIFASDTIESILGFVLYIVAFFYVFAFFGIYGWVQRTWFRGE